jgi:hypothetical protein
MHSSISDFKMKRVHHIYSIAITILFFIMISFVLMNNLLHFSKPSRVLTMEKREIASLSKIDFKHPGKFSEDYNLYYNDRFPFRSELIDYYSANICIDFFHRSPFPEKVELGRDGWMFFTVEGDIYRGKFMLPESKIEQIVREIHNRALYYHEKGIKFYLAIPPIKQSVYPEYLPLNYYKAPGKNVTEQIIDLISRDSLVKLVDVKSALLKAKSNGRLYDKTDDHWNALGAYYGYRAIIERMKQDFPILTPLNLSNFVMKTNMVKGMNIAENLHLRNYISEEQQLFFIKYGGAKVGHKGGYKPRPSFRYPEEFEIVRCVDNPALPKVVIVRDSYFNAMFPFMIENFSRTEILYDTFTYGIFDEAVRNEKPDLVLYMIFEPHLYNLIGINWW